MLARFASGVLLSIFQLAIAAATAWGDNSYNSHAAVVDAGTLLANDRNDEKGRWLRISLVEHAAFRCLPAPAPVDVPHEACAWASGDATDADRVEVLRLAGLVARQYASACLSPRAAPTREGDANRVCCAGSMLCLIDAAARMSTVESGTGQDDAFCRTPVHKSNCRDVSATTQS